MNTIVDPVGTASTLDSAGSGSCIPSFCQEYYDKTGRIPVILHVADGGTSIFVNNEWDPNYSGNNYVEDCLAILPRAEKHLNDLGWIVGKKSMLWHQGEADSGTAVQTYKDQFLELVDRCLQNGYDYFFYYEISETTGGNSFAQVREAQRLAHQERDNLYMIFSCANFEPQGLMSDNVHYNQTGYNLMGRQGAKYIANNIIKTKDNLWSLSKARTDVNMNSRQIKNLETGYSSSSAVNKKYVDVMSSKPQLLRAGRAYYDLEGNYGDRVGLFDGVNNGTSLVSGKIGQGVDLVGNNYVDIGNAMDINSGDFSVGLWYYPRSFNNGTNNIPLWNGGGNGPRWGIVHVNGANKVQLWTQTAGSITKLNHPQTLNFYQWYYIVATRSGSNGQVFVNNVKETGQVESGDISKSDDSKIGMTLTQQNDCIVDEVGIWDRVLSDQEVGYLYNQHNGTNNFATYDHTYPKAQSNLDMNQNQILNLASAQTNSFTISDDAVQTVSPPNNQGVMMASANGGVVMTFYDVGNGATSFVQQYGTVFNDSGSTDLTGSTGNDGTINISSNSGEIHIENRSGSQTTVRLLNIF